MISGLFGLNDNPLHFQISAPIQPGNSGGPILDDKGRVTGMAASSLNKVLVVKETGAIPENVNVGIHIDVIKRFIENEGIDLSSFEESNVFDPERSCVQIVVPPSR